LYRPLADEAKYGAYLRRSVAATVYSQLRRARLAAVRTAAAPVLREDVAPSPEQPVCDTAEAVFLASQVARLPATQRATVLARAQGRSVAQIAAERRVGYTAVHNQLTRATRSLRTSTLAVLGVFGRGWRTLTRRPLPAVGVVVVLGVLSGGIPVRTSPLRPAGPAFRALRWTATRRHVPEQPTRPATAQATAERSSRVVVGDPAAPAPAASVGPEASDPARTGRTDPRPPRSPSPSPLPTVLIACVTRLTVPPQQVGCPPG
jgi:hypothetical protein